MEAAKVIEFIESLAPPILMEAWDASGVQVAGDRREVRKIAVSLDPLPETISSALDWDADFILSHHPLTLTPRLPNRLDGFRKVLQLVLTSGAWLYAAHTTLDARFGGPADWLAGELGLGGLEVLAPSGPGGEGHGIGRVGDLPKAEATGDFLERLGGILGRERLVTAGSDPKSVSRVAYCPGSGASLMAEAAGSGAQLYVTGDVKYHQARDAFEAGLLVVDVGHFSLEEEMMRRFAGELDASFGEGGPEVAFFEGEEPFRVRPV